MVTIRMPEELPDWFDMERYEFEPTSEQEMHDAALAVLDRLPFYQAATAPGFDPKSVGDAERDTVLTVLGKWAADPYRRITCQWRGALQAALQPSVTDDDVAAFDAAIEWADAKDDTKCQQALEGIVESVSHLPAREKLLEVRKKVQELLEPGEEEREWTAPVRPQWTEKLLTYYAAAYMDLAIWAALAGDSINVRSLHDNYRKDSGQGEIAARIDSNQVSVRDFMEKLKDGSILQYLSRLEEEGK